MTGNASSASRKNLNFPMQKNKNERNSILLRRALN